MLQIPTQRIALIYGQYPTGNIELEARFGTFKERYFDTSITREVYNRIFEQFSTNRTNVVPIHEVTIDYVEGDIRRTVYQEPAREDVWITKNNIRGGRFDLPDYGIRLNMAQEIPVQPNPNFNPVFSRKKDRYSFLLLGGTVRLDLTVVTALTGKNIGHQSYEVELELLDRKYLPQFSSTIETILRLIQDTTIIYTTQQRGDLFSYLNGLLGKRPDRELLNPEIVVQARNLNMKDMVWGGIVGNPSTSYAVAHKADGIRRLLAFTPQGIWLVLPPFYATFVDSTVIPTITGTVLEGELIPKGANRNPGAPNSKYWFLTYDCLSAGGDRSVQNRSLIDRRVVCQGIADKFKDDRLLSIWTKTLEVLDLNRQGMPISDRVARFFEVMNTMFAQENNLAYSQDGLIFTPIFSPYNPGSDQKPLHERVLTRYPDICKWKPREKMTIDFSIEWYSNTEEGETKTEKKNKIRLYSGERVKGAPLKLVPFEGSFFHKFDGEVDHGNPITRALSDGTIVEYRFDLDRQMMVPVRPRSDKTYPNKIDVAISNWDWVHDPVKKETLLGETFDLVFKYHNRIKNGLFRSATQNYRDPTLLDIGSGRGGDVAKWKSFSRIVAVEPNQDYLPELRRRIELNGLKDRVLILNTGGEDTATISAAVNDFLGGPADVGSLMLSMSFFWRSSEMLDALAQTLLQGVKEDGEIIFLTIDGALVSEMFDPTFRGLKLTKLELGPATLEYVQTAGETELHIDIPGTIVEKQTEWLVHLYDLVLRMPNFEIKHLHRADTEKFLSSKEDVYTQMYSFGKISRIEPERTTITAPALPTIKIANVPRETRRGGNIPTPKNIEEGLPKAVEPAPPMAKLPEREKDRPIQMALPTIPKLARVPREEEGNPAEERKEERKEIRLALDRPPVRINVPTRPARPPRRRQLGWLTVRPPPNPNDPGIGDDVVQSLNVPWYQNVVRIADIGDGSCFMHALLKAFYQPYQENNSYAFRTDLVAKLRRDIAYALQLPAVFPDGEPIPVDPETIQQRQELGYLRGVVEDEFPYKINYETASDGAFPNIFLVQLAGEFLTDPHGRQIDFSLPGLQQLFNSHRDLGDEVYGYIADLFDLDVFVTYAYPENLETHIDTLPNEFERNRPAIVIAGNGIHYEVVGIDTPDGYQTVYMPNDPFITALVDQKQRTGRARAAAMIDPELAEAALLEHLQ